MENTKTKKKFNVRKITFTAVMAALIFVFTFTFKIPLGAGYAHLGDTMIFLAVLLLADTSSCLAAGIGAGLADFVGGYPTWTLPSFAIKFIMALICVLIAEKLFKSKFIGYVIGAIAGGAFQIVAYTVVKIIMIDKAYAISTLLELVIQTVVGIVAAFVLIFALRKSGAEKKLKSFIKVEK